MIFKSRFLKFFFIITSVGSFFVVSTNEIEAKTKFFVEACSVFSLLKIPKYASEQKVNVKQFFFNKPLLFKTGSEQTPVKKVSLVKVQAAIEKKSKESLPPPPPSSPEKPAVGGETNTYVPGQCTWYVKDFFKKRVGDNWGNAISWGINAQKSGLSVDKIPAANETIAVFGADSYNLGYGHVAVVIGVQGENALISEMNYGRPWNMNQRWVLSSEILSFIHV